MSNFPQHDSKPLLEWILIPPGSAPAPDPRLSYRSTCDSWASAWQISCTETWRLGFLCKVAAYHPIGVGNQLGIVDKIIVIMVRCAGIVPGQPKVVVETTRFNKIGLRVSCVRQ